MSPQLSRYERWCQTLGSMIKLKVSAKDEAKIKKDLEIAHLEVQPWQALTLSVMAFVSVFMLGILLSLASLLITGSFPFLFLFLMVLLSMFMFYFINGIPRRLASLWRLKASSQMVPAILYVVVYMRHTSNLEKAIAFASDNLQYPLALDFKKVFYNLQIGKFSTIKESLDNYLETWRDYSPEFIEAFHLVESSLFEPDNARRIQVLEKSLQVVLDGVYDKMLKFTHNVRSPLTNVYMLGVVLPTLALALLPLASAMVGEFLKWHHIFILFNLVVPFAVFYLTDKIMLLRPGGHGEASLLERNPLYYKYKSKAPYVRAFLIAMPFILIGLLPLIFQYTPIPGVFGLQKDYSFGQLGLTFLGEGNLFDFKEVSGGGYVGPFGIGALLVGLFVPFGIALFFATAYKGKTKELIVERQKTKDLEKEFNNSLFQLGNRLANGTPPELAFAKVAESAKGLKTEDFFKKVNYNIQQMGMGVDAAIFDERRGAIKYYPSDLIATSMRILTESVKKGLNIAAISLMSISQYVKNIQKISDRLRDLLAEIISDMKSNMTFLAPLLSGIVVGLAIMITSILNKLSLAQLLAGGAAEFGNLGTILSIFELTKMVPPYYLQIAVGIYLIQIIFILTNTLVTVDSGQDRLERANKIAKNLKKGIFLYTIVAFMATLVLFILGSVVLGNLV
jgi:Flp pilus assembly protein TadB